MIFQFVPALTAVSVIKMFNMYAMMRLKQKFGTHSQMCAIWSWLCFRLCCS